MTATSAVGGFESLLATLEAFLPNCPLEWHYRSEDERLIAFSNEHIYGGRLVTFPTARTHEAVRHVLVAHDRALGGQEESASREGEEVVRLVIEHAETRPEESLGVIAMLVTALTSWTYRHDDRAPRAPRHDAEQERP